MTDSRWGRMRRSRRAEEEFRQPEDHDGDEDATFPARGGSAERLAGDPSGGDPRRSEPPRPVPAQRPNRPPQPPGGATRGVEALFADDEKDEAPPPPPQLRESRPQPQPPPPPPAPEHDPVRESLRRNDPAAAGRQRTPAEAARDELAALLASTEAQTAPDPGDAAAGDPLVGPAVQPRDSSALEALTRAGEGESWDAIESMFQRRLEPDLPTSASDPALQLDWERPEMFTEPTQEEILRRIGELSHGLDIVQQRIDDLTRPLAEMTEPVTRLAAAFKRLELIERSFEEMRLQSERNTLKTSSALSSMDSSLGELRAAMEEPMWEMSERLTSAEIRLTELQANERMVEQLNQALSKDPFDLVSTRDIDELTENITTKVKRLGGRVERLEAALDRGLSGLEEARRAALGAAKEMNKLVDKASKALASTQQTRAREPREPAAKRTTAKSTAKKAAAGTKKAAARKPAAKRAARNSRS